MLFVGLYCRTNTTKTWTGLTAPGQAEHPGAPSPCLGRLRHQNKWRHNMRFWSVKRVAPLPCLAAVNPWFEETYLGHHDRHDFQTSSKVEFHHGQEEPAQWRNAIAEQPRTSLIQLESARHVGCSLLLTMARVTHILDFFKRVTACTKVITNHSALQKVHH